MIWRQKIVILNLTVKRLVGSIERLTPSYRVLTATQSPHSIGVVIRPLLSASFDRVTRSLPFIPANIVMCQGGVRSGDMSDPFPIVNIPLLGFHEKVG